MFLNYLEATLEVEYVNPRALRASRTYIMDGVDARSPGLLLCHNIISEVYDGSRPGAREGRSTPWYGSKSYREFWEFTLGAICSRLHLKYSGARAI